MCKPHFCERPCQLYFLGPQSNIEGLGIYIWGGEGALVSEHTAREPAAGSRSHSCVCFFLTLELMSMRQDLSLEFVCVKYFIIAVFTQGQLFQERGNFTQLPHIRIHTATLVMAGP